MRAALVLVSIVLTLAGCSKSASETPTDFSPYLHLQPGTRIKVTPLIKVEGAAPDVILEGFRKMEQDMISTGTLTSITKDQLMLKTDQPNMSGGFKPDGVRSIEVLEPVK